MKERLFNKDITDILFRLLFSSIFIGMGMEHLLSDDLIQEMMPDWLPQKRMISLSSGFILLAGGATIVVGYKVHQGAGLLALFLITVTIFIHGPELFVKPIGLSADWLWLWEVYQRSNFVKNLCLVGVCIHLLNYSSGKYSLDYVVENFQKNK